MLLMPEAPPVIMVAENLDIPYKRLLARLHGRPRAGSLQKSKHRLSASMLILWTKYARRRLENSAMHQPISF